MIIKVFFKKTYIYEFNSAMNLKHFCLMWMHLQGMKEETWFFLDIHFPTDYFQKFMLLPWVRYQPFVHIWLNIKAKKSDYQSMWYLLELYEMRNLIFCNIT